LSSSLGFDNYYETTLSSSCSAGDTTLQINTAPTATEGFLIIEPDNDSTREIIKYTGKTSSSLTGVTRAQGGTSASSHASGSTVRGDVVAEHFEALQDGSGMAATFTPPTASMTARTLTNPYKFSAYRNGAQTVTASTPTKIQFETENFDTNGNYDAATNFRYTAPVAGFYYLNARAENNGNGTMLLYLYKNGAELRRGQQAVIASGLSGIVVGDLLQLAANDYVEVFVYSDNTSISGGSNKTYFSGFFICAT
jgi:hypothetical protein